MPHLLLAIALLLTAIGVFFCLAAMKLALFGRAHLRKLRGLQRALAERCEELLERKLVLRVSLHLEAALCCCAAVALFTCWFLQATALPLWGRWTAAAGAFLAAGLAFLLIEQLLTLTATAKLLLAAAPFARFLAFLGFPFQKIDEALDARDDDDAQNTEVTAEDAIRSLVEEDDQEEADPAAVEDDLEQDEKRMLTGVMDLDGTLVHEIMTPRVDMDVISQDATLAQAKETIAKSGHSRIPVFGKSIDAIVGILYAKDLLDESRTADAVTIRDFIRTPTFIPETKNVADLLKEFRTRHNHMAIVLDEYGGTSGIVTIEDILEEIVGEIEDEFDHDAPPATPEPAADGTLTLDARTTIWDLNQALDLEIPEDEGYDTLAGYIMTTLGRIPKNGENVETPLLTAEILAASPRRLVTVKVRKRENTGNTPVQP